jgi:hypothetical protein
MKKAIKVLLINLAVAFGLALLGFIAGNGYNANDFGTALGLICLAGAVLDLLLSIVLFITGPAQYEVAKGFLLSSGVLFLVGFAACSGVTLNFH